MLTVTTETRVVAISRNTCSGWRCNEKKPKSISWKALVLAARQKCAVLEIWSKTLINCPK